MTLIPGETPAERALGRSCATGDGKVTFHVTDFSVTHEPNRHVTLAYQLTVAQQGREDEQWAFTPDGDDKSSAGVFASADSDPERLARLVHPVRALLEEWWDTKGHNRQSAKVGRRLEGARRGRSGSRSGGGGPRHRSRKSVVAAAGIPRTLPQDSRVRRVRNSPRPATPLTGGFFVLALFPVAVLVAKDFKQPHGVPPEGCLRISVFPDG